MSGDWIKMRVDLGDDPAVIGIASVLEIPEDLVVGKLHRLWSWADKHTSDGRTRGVTLSWVDRFVSSKGFSEALCKYGWLTVEGDQIIFPNFSKHNGVSAKARAEATIRQRLSRKSRDMGDSGEVRTITPAPFVRFIHERDGNQCSYCGWRPTSKERLGVDHLIPLSRGGKDVLENLVSCCSKCNNEKNDRTPEEFGLIPKFLPEGVSYLSQKICDIRTSTALLEKRREEYIKPSSSEPIEKLPLKAGGEFSIEASYVAELDRAYPAVDVPRTLREIRAWMISNPDRQKTAGGIRRCVNTWMAKEQAKHGG